MSISFLYRIHVFLFVLFLSVFVELFAQDSASSSSKIAEEYPTLSAELVLSRGEAISLKNQKNAIQKKIKPVEEDLKLWYNLLNRNPEIGYNERKTAAFLSRMLEGFGWKVMSNIGSGNSLLAVFDQGRPGKTILIKVDMDALPYTDRQSLMQGNLVNSVYNFGGRMFYLMHGAGHDAHMAIALAFAKLIAQEKAKVDGKIILAFQSGEYSTTLGNAHGSDILLQSDFFLENKPDFSIGFQVDPKLGIGEIGLKEGTALPMATVMNVNIYPEAKSKIDFVDNTNTLYNAFAHMIIPIQQTIYEERFLLGKALRIDFNAINGAPFLDVPAQEIEASAMLVAFDETESCHVQDRLSEVIGASSKSMGVIGVPSFYAYAPLMINDKAMVNAIKEADGMGNTLRMIDKPQFYVNSFSKYANLSRAGGLFFWIGGGGEQLAQQDSLPSGSFSLFTIPSDQFRIHQQSLSMGLLSLYQVVMLAEKASIRPLNK